MKRHTAVLLIVLALVLAACSRRGADAPQPEQGQPAQPPPTNRIEIPATVRSNLGITFAPVERRRVDATIRIPGAFELLPRARREYRMTLEGRIELAVDQYETIAPGDLLFRFRSPRWQQMQQDLVSASREIETARADVEIALARLEEADASVELLERRLAGLSEAQVRQADLELRAAELRSTLPRLRAEWNAAQARLSGAEAMHQHALLLAATATGRNVEELSADVGDPGRSVPAYREIDWIEVRALAAGSVELVAATDGAFVEATSLVVSTVDPAMVRFRASALQGDLPRLAGGSGARLAPPETPRLPFADAVAASFTIGLEADPQQRTVSVLAFPEESRGWIRPGLSAFLEIVTDTSGGPALAIPRAAIVRDGMTHVFFRRDPLDANKAIRVEADMGVSDGRWVVINSGISLRDQIILDGAYELKLATQQSGALQKGHFHADGTFHAEH
jgi:multidrug efflux pump subunit AcrA (membrane-fusion protein)